MANIEEALTSTDPFEADSAELVKNLAATPKKAARLSFAKATYAAELQSIRNAARTAGFSLVKIPNFQVRETEDTISAGYKLRDKIEVTPHTRPNRKKKGESEGTEAGPGNEPTTPKG